MKIIPVGKQLIDSDKLIPLMRSRIVNTAQRKVLIANIVGSLEEKDDYTKINCGGLGRVRLFTQYKLHGGCFDSLDEMRTQRMLLSDYPSNSEVKTQVFQLSGCTWRCWYCFVDEKLLSGNSNAGTWVSSDELLDNYLATPDRADIIDLSGGQPDLAPEWIVWMMEAINKKNLSGRIFLRSEDNLSNDLMWQVLTPAQLDLISNFPNYSRIGCFKGFDYESFSFNTRAHPQLFDRQFDIARKIINSGIDFFAHITLTGASLVGVESKIHTLFDRLQDIHPLLPLRVVPLTIKEFSAWHAREFSGREEWSRVQAVALEAWANEMFMRFTASQRVGPFEAIRLD